MQCVCRMIWVRMEQSLNSSICDRLCCIPGTEEQQSTVKVELSKTPFKNALCLDGSPPVYYVSKGHSTKKWMVWLEVVHRITTSTPASACRCCHCEMTCSAKMEGSSCWPVWQPLIHTHARPRCPGRRLVREDT